MNLRQTSGVTCRDGESSQETKMADHTPDMRRIDIDQEHEVRYWTKVLGIKPERLREAVRAAGSSVEAVRKHLLDHTSRPTT
jgi:hypothetical protein